jgi:hypothetical protein
VDPDYGIAGKARTQIPAHKFSVVVYPFEAELATIAWFGVRLGPSTFAIFDAFPDEAGRQAHLAGKVAAALMAKAGDLLAQPPAIQKADVLASKLPG